MLHLDLMPLSLSEVEDFLFRTEIIKLGNLSGSAKYVLTEAIERQIGAFYSVVQASEAGSARFDELQKAIQEEVDKFNTYEMPIYIQNLAASARAYCKVDLLQGIVKYSVWVESFQIPRETVDLMPKWLAEQVYNKWVRGYPLHDNKVTYQAIVNIIQKTAKTFINKPKSSQTLAHMTSAIIGELFQLTCVQNIMINEIYSGLEIRTTISDGIHTNDVVFTLNLN